MPRSALVSLFLAAVAALTVAVWLYSANQAVHELDRRGQSDLALASDRLVGALFRYRQLAVTLASSPRIGANGVDRGDLAGILLRAADVSGALDLVVLDLDGDLVASASGLSPNAWNRLPFVDRARNGALGRELRVSDQFGRRAYYIAVPIFSESGPVERVLVAIVDLEAIEADFRGARPAVFMADARGIVHFTNRSELVLRSRNSDVPGFKPFVDYSQRRFFGTDIWTVSAGRYLPRRALHVERDLPVVGMRAEALIDLRPALANSFLQAAVAAAICLLLGSAIYFMSNQRRLLARANEILEVRVARRTRELSELNVSLRQEVIEREEAQRALRRAQDDLVQAGKLGALGKMSAGISHELNQPLMAIQSFAQNSATFLDRGDTAAVGRNIARIGDLAHRMARIIRNFRAFARQEKDKVSRVDLVQIVQAALDLAMPRISDAGIRLVPDLPHGALWVQGGEVRLQQVVLNLLSNAVDAMTGAERRDLGVSVAVVGGAAVVTVSDTGPGIEAPDKVFEPFYTTKEIGEADGVGLGLSISYGLVQSFGGTIRGANRPDGGAVFTVALQPWADEAAA